MAFFLTSKIALITRIQVEQLLEENNQINGVLALNGAADSLVDTAIFPFIRQFANVDKTWFAQSSYRYVQQWLLKLSEKGYFLNIMKNRPVWQQEHKPLWVLEPDLKTRDQFLKKAMLLL